jgi:lysophospholipid acyltransferase (LPLAT)-like uncharacterized protein
LIIRAISGAFSPLVKLLGATTRFEVEGWENWQEASKRGAPIFTFWHNRILLMLYFWRNRQIAVMTSKSFDGEYIARVLQRFGCGAVRGSSSRGGVGALVEMVRLARAGIQTGFAVDGPRGPRYKVKMGPIILAKKSGSPVLPMTVELKRYWQAKTWDGLQIPLPFSHATVKIGKPIWVSEDVSDSRMDELLAELQSSLDQLNGEESGIAR